MAEVRRKCFISYHHADQAEVDRFVRTFDHGTDTFIARGLGQEMSQDIIASRDTDYVMRRIRELYLRSSSVTLVMLGKCTWARRYVDWEMQASLRHGEAVIPNGLLAIKLPSFPGQGGCFPQRLNENLLGHDNTFARWMAYPTSTDSLATAIEQAYLRRTSHAKFIVNRRDRFENNRPC